MLDYAQAQRLVTRAEMEARATGRRHDDVLRELLDERPATARPMGSEFEACLFRALRDAGLPLPKAQYRVLMADGSEVFLDFALPLPLVARSFGASHEPGGIRSLSPRFARRLLLPPGPPSFPSPTTS
jgi:hypothetical protein